MSYLLHMQCPKKSRKCKLLQSTACATAFHCTKNLEKQHNMWRTQQDGSRGSLFLDSENLPLESSTQIIEQVSVNVQERMHT